MKKIAIILIRKNSKGLVDKNIKLFCGKPLCFYTIDIAINSGLFDEIWISSDAQEYLDICKEEYGEQCKYIIRNKKESRFSRFFFYLRVFLDVLFATVREFAWFCALVVCVEFVSELNTVVSAERLSRCF